MGAMRAMIMALLLPLAALAGERAAVLPLQDIGLVDAGLHADDPAKNWESERANEAAGAVLSQLGGWMAHPQEVEAGALEKVCGARVTFTPPRPVDFREVFSSGALTVRRSAGGGVPVEGREKFAAALAGALPGAAGAGEAWVKFKIISVTVGKAEWRTQAVCQAAVHTGEGHLQAESLWDCTWAPQDGAAPVLKSVAVSRCEETFCRSSAPAFTDCTEAVLHGVADWREQFCRDTDYWAERIEQRYFADSSGWQGISLGDVNGDGLDDIYVPQSGGLPNRLFLHQPDGTLRDFTVKSGTGWWDHTNAVIIADFDNDGDQDLALGMLYGVVFMQNDGKAYFTVAATQLTPEAQPYSMAAADYDNDGDLDLYVTCYSPRAVHAGNRFLARPVPYHDAKNGGRNVLLRNERSWKFRDVTKASGMDENNRRFSLACAWEDIDNDGDQDLHVANDFGRDTFYRNEGRDASGEWRFKEAGAELGLDDIGAGMSVSWGDVDRDGFMDLYVSNMWSSAGHRVTEQAKFMPEGDGAVRADFQHHARGNSLFHNEGGRRFTDASEPAGVSLGRWAWGSTFLDLNNDGWQDLYVANGYFTRPDPGDL